MKKPAPVSERFARVVLWELAEIHALLMNVCDHSINESSVVPEKKVSSKLQQQVKEFYSKKEDERQKRIYKSLLEYVDLGDDGSHPTE
jgi:hypothetical protein